MGVRGIATLPYEGEGSHLILEDVHSHSTVCFKSGKKYECHKRCYNNEFLYDGVCYRRLDAQSLRDLGALNIGKLYSEYDLILTLLNSTGDLCHSFPIEELKENIMCHKAPCMAIDQLGPIFSFVILGDHTCFWDPLKMIYGFKLFKQALSILQKISLMNWEPRGTEEIVIFKNFYDIPMLDCGNGTMEIFDNPLITDYGFYIDVGQGFFYHEKETNWLAWTKPSLNQVNYFVWVCVMNSQLCLHAAHVSDKNLPELITIHPDIMFIADNDDNKIICLDGLNNFTSSHLLAGT